MENHVPYIILNIQIAIPLDQISEITSMFEQPQPVKENPLTIKSKVILENDEEHSVKEVMGQLMYALGVSPVKAMNLIEEVHENGETTVFEGFLEEALEIQSKLEEIGLKTRLIMEGSK